MASSKSQPTQAALLYIPAMRFDPNHHTRDQGGIASAMADRGVRTRLVVGELVADYEPRGYRIVETGNTNLLNIASLFREFLTMFAETSRDPPDVILAWNSSFLNPILFMILRLTSPRMRLSGRMRLILRLDWDGVFRESRLASLALRARLMLNSLVFDLITVESTCGFDRVRPMLLLPNKLRLVRPGHSVHAGDCGVATPVGPQKRILSVSRIRRSKGVHVLLRAFKSVTDSHPDWSLVIVGRVDEEAYMAELQALVVELGIQDRVRFTGPQSESELDSWYRSSAIFCLVSYVEGFSMSKIEALAWGLPVVTTEAGCSKDLDGAIVVPFDSPSDTARALIDLIADENLRKSFAATGKSFSSQMTCERIADTILTLH